MFGKKKETKAVKKHTPLVKEVRIKRVGNGFLVQVDNEDTAFAKDAYIFKTYEEVLNFLPSMKFAVTRLL